MLYEKAQKEVFTAIMSGERVAGCMDGKGGFIVSPDCYKAFIFPLSIVAFNLDKVENFVKFKEYLDDVKPENEIRLLPFTRDDSLGRSRQRIRMLDNHGTIVYANERFFAYWQAPKFYQASGKPLEKIIVTEKTGSIEKPVGLFLPMRCEFKETINIQEVETDEG